MKKVASIVTAALLYQFTLTNGSGIVKEGKIKQWQHLYEEGILGRQRDSVLGQPQDCVDNKVVIDGETFPCDNVDFLSFVSLQDMEITQVPHQTSGLAGSDIWGWLSPTGREFTLMCMDNGVAFIDTTEPTEPCIIGLLPAARRGDPWCDVKVFKDTAYIVKDSRGGDFANDTTIGGEVVDLLRIDQLECPDSPVILENDYVWDFHGSSHNLIVNTETGYLYSVGGDYCDGGLIVIDLNKNRLRPEYVNCIDGDGYTHDAQCVIYDGPDQRYQGREICFAFNEDTLTIWDVDFKFSPSMLARITYPSQTYSHQGWLNNDMSKILLDDELNEICASPPPLNESGFCSIALGPSNGINRTSTVLIDVTSLTDPFYNGTYFHEDVVIDHNLYVWGPIHEKGWGGNPPLENPPNPNYAYLNNYLSGLRILDISSNDVDSFTEIGYFDIAPDLSDLSFLGAWSGYLHPSGAYAISSIDRGLFMLRPNMAFDPVPPPPPTAAPTEDPAEEIFFTLLIVVAALLAVVIILLLPFVVIRSRRPVAEETEQMIE